MDGLATGRHEKEIQMKYQLVIAIGYGELQQRIDKFISDGWHIIGKKKRINVCGRNFIGQPVVKYDSLELSDGLYLIIDEKQEDFVSYKIVYKNLTFSKSAFSSFTESMIYQDLPDFLTPMQKAKASKFLFNILS